MRRKVLFFFTGLIFLLCGSLCSASVSEKPAVDAAKRWLTLVDKGQYEESWQEASSLFKQSVTKEQWMQAAKGTRETLGKMLTREFSSSEMHTSLPGVPDGQYVVIVFKSSFAKKKQGLETITPMLDKDGSWRISGYYIK